MVWEEERGTGSSFKTPASMKGRGTGQPAFQGRGMLWRRSRREEEEEPPKKDECFEETKESKETKSEESLSGRARSKLVLVRLLFSMARQEQAVAPDGLHVPLSLPIATSPKHSDDSATCPPPTAESSSCPPSTPSSADPPGSCRRRLIS